MINASVAKLNQYSGDPVFDRIMNEIEAAQDDGLVYFEIDVHNLDTLLIFDLSRALGDLGYIVDHNDDAETLEIEYDE